MGCGRMTVTDADCDAAADRVQYVAWAHTHSELTGPDSSWMQRHVRLRSVREHVITTYLRPGQAKPAAASILILTRTSRGETQRLSPLRFWQHGLRNPCLVRSTLRAAIGITSFCSRKRRQSQGSRQPQLTHPHAHTPKPSSPVSPSPLPLGDVQGHRQIGRGKGEQNCGLTFVTRPRRPGAAAKNAEVPLLQKKKKKKKGQRKEKKDSARSVGRNMGLEQRTNRPPAPHSVQGGCSGRTTRGSRGLTPQGSPVLRMVCLLPALGPKQ